MVNRNLEPVAPGEPNGTVPGYSWGLAVKTGLQLPSASASANAANQFGKNYVLTLPRRSAAAAAGACTWSAPVEFLVDSRDACDVRVTGESCSAGSLLDASVYAPSAGWGVATGPLVLSSQAAGNLTDTDVHFLCVNGPTSYVRSSVSSVNCNCN